MMIEPNVGKEVAIKFLRNYHEFGSRAHLITVASLNAAIKETTNADDCKLLAVKIFSEFMAALENLGAMSIAIRHRDEGVGLVYSFLTYGIAKLKLSPSTSLTQIFELLKSGDGLVKGLRLPSLVDIIHNDPPIEQTSVPILYQETNTALAKAATVYLAQDQALVRAYNKTKHGFVVVSDHHIFQPDPPKIENGTAWIAAKNPDYDPSNPSRTPVVELFAIRLEDVQPTLNRISIIRGALMFMTELAAVLLEKGIISSADSKA